VHQYHFYRDMRTYGKFELLYAEAAEKGSAFVKFPDDEPPTIEKDAQSGRLTVTARDLLSEGEEVALTADLVVLVTGMVPRENEGLTKTLKLPVGQSGFYNEIHPKLRPVETVVDGAYICGACQAPRTSSESVASGLAAVTQSAAILKRGFAELDPLVATVDTEACTWCGACETTCPYAARRQGDRRHLADILQRLRGLRARLPVRRHRPAGLHRRPDQSHDRRHAGGGVRMSTTIRDVREIIRDEQFMRALILKVLEPGPQTIPQIAEALDKPSNEVVFWVMGLRKYGWIAEIKEVDDDGYFQYQSVPREES
jgi:ferredoxin